MTSTQSNFSQNKQNIFIISIDSNIFNEIVKELLKIEKNDSILISKLQSELPKDNSDLLKFCKTNHIEISMENDKANFKFFQKQSAGELMTFLLNSVTISSIVKFPENWDL